MSRAYDLRAPEPRPTALAAMVRDLAHGKQHDHPVLEQPGWWEAPGRFVYGPTPSGERPPADSLPGRPLLITGAAGTLGRAFGRICSERGLPHRLLTRPQLDVAEPSSVAAAIDEFQPWGIINAAGYARVNASENNRDRCHRENATGPAVLAEACAARGLRLLTFSSDLVFGGDQDRPHIESDPVRPLSSYGAAKAMAEERVLHIHPQSLVVRSSAFFGPWDPYNFVTAALVRLKEGMAATAPCDIWVSPTYVPDLVESALDLLIDGELGIWHLTNDGATTWQDLARKAAELAEVDTSALVACRGCDLGWAARRPTYSVLGSERGWMLPDLDDALARFVRDRECVDTSC